MTEPFDVHLPLPAGYRHKEVLAFHQRDPAQLAERLDGDVLSKALMLDGMAIVLHIQLSEAHAAYRIDATEALSANQQAKLHDTVVRMLGLHLDPTDFEAQMIEHPLLGRAVTKQTGLRIPQTASAFEAISWAITGQQITLSFAITLRRRLIEVAGVPHPSGMICYPEAAHVAQLDADTLGQLQFSRAKSEALLRVAKMIEAKELDLSQLAQQPIEQARSALVAIKGIGPWTANYALMRGLGAADCSLHGDVAVRNAIARLRADGVKPSQNEAEQILAEFAPYRSLAAAHLWASLATFSA